MTLPTDSLADTVIGPHLTRISQGLDAFRDEELWRLTDEQALAAAEAAYEMAHRAHAAALEVLGEVDSRAAARHAGAPSTQAWLAATQRLRPGMAKRDVRLARLIHRQPGAAAAETDGRVEGDALAESLHEGTANPEQAAAIEKALTELPDDASVETRVLAEELLVEQARYHGPLTLTRIGHRILERIDPEAADRVLGQRLEAEERRAHRLRSGRRWTDGHGSVFYRFRLPEGEDGVAQQVLDALSAPQPCGETGRDERTAEQRYADGFIDAMRRVSLDGGLPDSGGDRPRVVVLIDFDRLRDQTGHGVNFDTEGQLSPAAVRRAACDAQILPAVLGGAGQVLDVGRAQRCFAGAARTAVLIRDQGCVHPGCDRPPRWCDVHHVQPWWDGGETKPTNGVTLCGFHHRLYDSQEWQIRFTDDEIPESIPPPWVDPDQRPIRHPRFLTHRRPRAA